jgi:predicted flap endonuclease-1-like 5' DNA nuclease
MSTTDPRTNIDHPVHIGQVYRDARTEEKLTLTYLDRNVYVVRDESGYHRVGPREELDKNVGSKRFRLDPDAEEWGGTGRLSRVIQRANEYEKRGGRKNEHYAEAMREAVEILQDTGAKDAHETVEFETITGVGEKTASRLRSAGYTTRQDIRRADNDELLDVGGVGEGNLSNIRDECL